LACLVRLWDIMSYVEGSEGPLGESANAGGSDRLSGSSPSIDKDFTLPTATQFERELDQVRAAEALMALEGHQPETMTIPDTQELRRTRKSSSP